MLYINLSKILGIKNKRVIQLKLSTKGQYSLKAMVDLAIHYRDDVVTISQIASRQGMSESYLEQLFPKLRKAGLVESVRGAGGGYRLARSLESVSVGDILRAAEGDLIPVECVLTSDKECSREDSCVVKYVWKKVTDSINETVDNITLADMVKQYQEIKA